MISSPVPQPGKPMASLPPLSYPPPPPKQKDKDVTSRAANSHPQWLLRSCSVWPWPFLGTSPGQGYSLFMGWASCREDRRWHVIPSQMLRRYKCLPTDLCQLKITWPHLLVPVQSCAVLLLNPRILVKQKFQVTTTGEKNERLFPSPAPMECRLPT